MGCLLVVPIGYCVNSLGLLVVVLYWYSCCYSCAVCVYLYPCCIYHDGCMAVPVTGTALDLALLLGLCLICRMGFCGLGCTNAANFNAGLLG
jgi:hypothetical protein